MNFKLISLIIFSIFKFADSYGQSHEDTGGHMHLSRHRVSIMIGHTHVPKGIENSQGKGPLIIPSWGLNYSYIINEKWAVGWHNDMEISTYYIQDEHGGELERERPLITSLVGIFKPWHHMAFLLGAGREFEKHKNFWVFRAGVEFEFEIGNSWDLSPSLIYDLKESVYDS
jgi:hypothetical protein